mgnify:FL=1|tara:strand:- start:198 stop:779 length:582 start_codon:yes stop_codon:yes gene_type:complete
MFISKFILGLAFLMASLVAISNFLVQFPVNYFGMESILTYAAFTYPITFLITDLANRKYGKFIARRIVYLGFLTGVLLTLYFSTNFEDLISIRIAIGSGTAFLFAQLLDVSIFDILRKKKWFVAPLTSSLLGSIVDTFLFFSISFYNTAVPWISLALGDFIVKLLITLLMLIPFKILLKKTMPTEIQFSGKLF